MGSDSKKKKKEGEKKKENVVKKVQEIELRVELHCKKCCQRVLKKLSEMKGVSKVDVELSKNKVTVTGTPEADELLKKLKKLGKTADLWTSKSKEDSELEYYTVKEVAGQKVVLPADSPNPCPLM